MPKATFTARWVASIQAPERGQLDYFDSKPPTLGLRVSYGGKKSWFVMYRYQGRLRRLTLGIYPHLSLADARSKATTIRHSVAQGEDPATEKQTLRQAPTVAEVIEQFMTLYSKPHKKSWRSDHAIFQKEILPAAGLVKGVVDEPFGGREQMAVDLHVVPCRVDFRAELADDAAVDADPPFEDESLGRPA